MNKKFMILSAIALLVGGIQTTSAQNWRNAPQCHFGIRGGISSTNSFLESWGVDDGTNSLTAPTFGISFDTKIAKIPFYVETGLYYMNRGYKDDDENNSYKVSQEECDNHSLLVPALISYHAYVGKNVALQPFFGPFISYGFDEEEFDCGWRLGCGISVKKFYANFGFDLCVITVGSIFATVGWNFLGNR